MLLRSCSGQPFQNCLRRIYVRVVHQSRSHSQVRVTTPPFQQVGKVVVTTKEYLLE
jgi:hypothetical protein